MHNFVIDHERKDVEIAEQIQDFSLQKLLKSSVLEEMQG